MRGREQMTRREQVIRAQRFQGPEYLPLFYFNGDRRDSDIMMADVELHFTGPKRTYSEWGFHWHRADRTMGQPEAPILNTQKDIDLYVPPDPDDPARFLDGEKLMAEYGPDRYYVAALGFSGFTIMTFLRGFSRLLEEFYTDRGAVEQIADIVFGTEEGIVKAIQGRGYDAVAFFDDWGTQSGMIISPELWREFFAPRYRRQFELCHALGLDVYFHSCGYYLPVIGDLIDLGVDFLNISQPNVYDIPSLGTEFSGKVCFVCPVSYQTTSISGSCDEIRAAVDELFAAFATPRGGLIGYVEEYDSIGLSDENYRCCVDAFRSFGPTFFHSD